jgi:glycerol uptake facilitator protein
VSGGHFNPAVTLAFALRGALGWLDAAYYALAQLVGGIAGALLVWLTYGETGASGGLGATRLADRLDSGGGYLIAIIIEAAGAFALMFVILALTTSAVAASHTTALGIGLTLGLANLALASVTGASLNFARTFGPDLALAFAGENVMWGQLVVYLVGPAIGAVAAGYTHAWLTGRVRTLDEAGRSGTRPDVPRQPAGRAG